MKTVQIRLIRIIILVWDLTLKLFRGGRKSGGAKYKAAEKLAIKFVAQLLKERGWGIDRVRKHQDWSGKYCPHRVLSEGRWNEVKAAIDAELKAIGGKSSSKKTTSSKTA